MKLYTINGLPLANWCITQVTMAPMVSRTGYCSASSLKNIRTHNTYSLCLWRLAIMYNSTAGWLRKIEDED